MTKAEMIINALESLDIHAKTDSDGDILIRYQLKTFYIPIGDDDDSYVSVIYPRFHEFEEGDDQLMLQTSNKVSRDFRMIKTHVDLPNKNVTASCEFYYNDLESLTELLRHTLRLLGIVRSTFRTTMDKFKSAID